MLKKLNEIRVGCSVVKIYKDSFTLEYICKLHVAGRHNSEADYYTDDKDDALLTARVMASNSHLYDEMV